MDEKINLPCTPLRAIGEEGKPATIVDFQESYSAVEGLNCAITRGVAAATAPSAYLLSA